MSNEHINAGVHASTGFEFQKHCVLYILLDKWDIHKESKYFLCIEHHDDVLFCYQTEDELIESINAYQAKKSSTAWGMTKNFYEILQKILDVGKALTNDMIPKTPTYSHQLTFISNTPINIPSHKVNETNQAIKFVDLATIQQDSIKEKIKNINPDLSEIDSLVFAYIDFGKTSKSQKQQLIGMFADKFNSQVKDHKAAVDTLLSLFRDIETTFNQGATTTLLDSTKRLDSEKINQAMDVITTRSKAFDLWRNKKDEIGRVLEIGISLQIEFELSFENSFDLFKDLKQVEHQKIFNFVEKNKSIMCSYYSDKDCIKSFYDLAIVEKVLRQDELHLKASLFAAYIEIKDR